MTLRNQQPISYTRPHMPVLPRRRVSIANKRWMPWLVGGAVLAFGFTMLFMIVVLVGAVYLSEDRIPSGVKVAGLPLGGRTLEAATAALQSYPFNPTITVTDLDRHWTLTLANLGVRVDMNATIQAAQQAASGADVKPYYTVDLNQAQTALIDLSQLVNIDAVPGNPPQIGRSLEIPVMLDRLRRDVTGELADGVFELNMIEVEPPREDAPNYSATQTTTHIVQPGQELALIAREYGVSTQDIVRLNNIANADLIYVGQELTIPAPGVYTPTAPAAPSSTGKSILVSTSEQRIYAYENGQLVRSHLVSTGRSATPTVLGDYNIYVKYTADDMSGPDYFLPQVPYTMYFYQGYAIHGTYWHNSFGRPMSHGCVNLPTNEAQWFFNWAEVGTLVRVV